MFCCSSCATVFNKSEQKISLWTNEPTQLIVATDTLSTKSTQHFFTAKRQKAPLPITVLGDSLQRKFELATHDSFAYTSNYFFPHVNLLLGYLIDRKADKRYAYPTVVSVDLNQNQRDYYDYNLFKKVKQLIKVTPLKIFGFHNASIELAYERPTGSDFSTQLMVSYLISNSIYRRSADLKENTKGYRLALEERFFFKKDAPYGPYFALELDYLNKHSYTKREFAPYEDGLDPFDYYEDSYKDTFIVNATYLSRNFKFGYQKEFSRIFIDMYIGLGVRKRNISHSDRINPADVLLSYQHFDTEYS